jgi:hypothetical protein
METLRSILLDVQPRYWACTLDLKDAYFLVPIFRGHRKYLAFEYRGQHHRFRALPFGLTSAPRVFTRVAQVIVTQLRHEGLRVHAYLDDWIILGRSPRDVMLARDRAVALLQSLGFYSELGKVPSSPFSAFRFLGATLDLRNGLVFPNQKRVDSLREVT